MPTVEKLSVSVPRTVWADARRFVALDSSETNSALVTRLVKEAVDRAKDEAYARGYAEQPPTEEEDAIGRAAFAAGAAELRAQELAAGLPVMGGGEAYERWKAWRAAR